LVITKNIQFIHVKCFLTIFYQNLTGKSCNMLNDKILFIKELLVPVFTYSSAQSLMELHENPDA